MEKNTDSKTITKKRKRLLGRVLLLLALAALLTLAPYGYDAVRNDPNLLLKKISTVLTEGSPVDVKYTIKPGKRKILFRNRLPLYSFTPEESGEYTFAVSDIVSEEDVFLSLQVMDNHLNNYLSTDNANDHSDSFSDTVFLNEGSICYIIIDAASESDKEEYSGSFSLSVTKAAEESKPAEVTETEPAVIKLTEDSQTAVLFVPDESGFFRFTSRIVSRDKTASSVISSVKTTDNEEIKRAEGICRLEGGKEYYVWVSAQDLSTGAVRAKVRCSRINSVSTDQPGEYRISGDTIIEFTSPETKNLAVHSVSDGDVRCLVYDSRGFPLNSDDDSGGDLTGNEKDFALVVQAQRKTSYLIYVYGHFNECDVVITDYNGDGSSVGEDDIPEEHQEEEPPEDAAEE